MARRYASVGHRDKAEPYFIAAHRAAGDSVLQISVKDGPDLVIGWAGDNHLVEVKSEIEREGKDGYKRKSKGKLKPGQEDFSKTWRGGRVIVAFTPVESLRAVGHTDEAILGALWDAGLHWMMPAHKGPEPTAAQWKKCKAKKCEHATRPNYRPPKGAGVDAAAEAEATFAPPPEWGGPHVCAVGNRSGSWKDCRGRLARLSPAVGAELRCVTHMPEFTEQHLSTLRCQRPGCGDSWGEHDHSESPIPGTEPERCRREGCGCTGYVGMGQASLLSAASD